MTALPTISVVVPSYRRPGQLIECLDGLFAQERPADQIVVVRRDTDEETQSALRPYADRVDEAVVSEPGVLAAMRVGMDAATSEVIAFTDDDAVARPAWLRTLVSHYADPTVGGAGGRDVYHPDSPDPLRPVSQVGRFSAWGALIGNHHVGDGPSGDVDILKGVNMSFRREALALPVELSGAGAQVHFEIAGSLWARQQGWRLVFDPSATVDHYHGVRFDDDQRGRPKPVAIRNEAYNLVVCMLSFRRELLWRRAAYGLLVGDRATPGLGRAGVALLRRETDVLRRVAPAVHGQVLGLVAVLRRRPLPMARPSGAR